MEQGARQAREGVPLYDPGFPFLRVWLYGIGGFAVAAAAFAIGLVIARPGSRAGVEERATIAADRPVDEVLVVRPAAEQAKVFPSFAPEGVIVVPAPSAGERAFAAVAPAQSERRVETVRRPRVAERRPPVAVARAEPNPPRTRETEAPIEEARREVVEAPRQIVQPARDEAPPVREYEEARNEEISEPEQDNRSWYGSAEYRREVAERRRAEREARRRRNDGWW